MENLIDEITLFGLVILNSLIEWLTDKLIMINWIKSNFLLIAGALISILGISAAGRRIYKNIKIDKAYDRAWQNVSKNYIKK